MSENFEMDPERLKSLPPKEIPDLVKRIREMIVQSVAANGGHLASNLGVVELTVALHRVFSCPEDQIVFDVGHQCYAHKILTGRASRMNTLRRFNGLSGFPKHEESAYDIYDTGHASTAISAALGLARARDLKGGTWDVIAVVGDGAFTGGLCYEALNDAGTGKTRLIVILNDNGMSISPNVGAMSNYLTTLRTSQFWIHLKQRIARFLMGLPFGGKSIHEFFRRVKDFIRNALVRDRFFDSLGFRYLGPVDGQDEERLEHVLKRAKQMEEPVLIHVLTKKGCGYQPSEIAPDKTHGVKPFDIKDGQPIPSVPQKEFSKFLGESLARLGQENKNLVAVTAAMGEATGLSIFGKAFPKRYYDVGIAEAHAVVLACGLARGGMKPFVAIYDTFMQRAYDQMIEDACLQNLPVCFLMDRAGLGGDDGPSHHGVFGVSFLRHIPNLSLWCPLNLKQFEQMLVLAATHSGPLAIRYPRAENKDLADFAWDSFIPGQWEELRSGGDAVLIALGTIADQALETAEHLNQKGIKLRVISASSVKPLDEKMIREAAYSNTPFYTLEEQAGMGGFGSAVCEYCLSVGIRIPSRVFALPDRFIPQGTRLELLAYAGLDAGKLSAEILEDIKLNRHETAG